MKPTAELSTEHTLRALRAPVPAPPAGWSPEAPMTFPESPSFCLSWVSNTCYKEKRSLGHKREIHLLKTYYVLEIHTVVLGNELKLENSPLPNWATAFPFNRQRN